ncbi:GNAT family N-acetyltransferase [Planomonospora corallina]|uniref:GNAT family N-acetyltransferase n=1 Tax=Planomonospora corallina TaxID=1806052 RepID=A0ABV8IBJ2_9ACTN
MGVQVRAGGPDDVEAVLHVKNASWRSAYRGLVPQDVLDGLAVTSRAVQAWRELIGSGERHLVVGEDGGRITGFSVYGPAEDAGIGGGEVYAIYVLAEHWSTGLGLALMTRSVDHLRELGHDRAGLWVLEGNTRARRFYERFGFAPTGRVEDVPGLPAGIPELHYGMTLGPLPG